ncbi:MAG TPA: aminotransferase class I/II-fold pyridoxal phosphate-dependent enzyme [Thermoanaerobaculia bacterium]|nr:aminotransferase class I/II-fold pyridoxal phosphate-dependent enzyme [Thermoanaerobaculia bacterium]
MLKELMTLTPADRTTQLGFSDIVKIRNRVLALKESGMKVLQLEGGEPFHPTPDPIKEALKRAVDENQTRYAPSSGIAPLLAAIEEKLARRNRTTFNRDELVVTNGGMHGLFCAFQATVNPGDEVIFFSPYWTPIRDLVTFCGGKPVLIPWSAVRAGALESSLRTSLSPRTRAIYVNTPSNPTGDVLSLEQLQTIALFAERENLVIISDEAYEDLTYDEARHISIASLPGMRERTISVYTLSKSYSMTGWRVGYVAATLPWIGVIQKLVLNSINGVSTPTQFAAVAAIRDCDSHIQSMKGEYLRRRDLLTAIADRAGFGYVRPRGAFYLFADVSDVLGTDSWAAMNRLLETTGVATVPGLVFGEAGEGHLRMSFSTSLETLEEVAAAIESLR